MNHLGKTIGIMKIKIQMICEEGRNTSFPKNASWLAKIIVLTYGGSSAGIIDMLSTEGFFTRFRKER